MKVEQNRDKQFEVWLSERYDPDATIDLAELVELYAAVQRALFDYLASNVSAIARITR